MGKMAGKNIIILYLVIKITAGIQFENNEVFDL